MDAAPLGSAQGLGLGLGRAVAVALPGAGGQAGYSPQAEAGGRAGGGCSTSPLGLRLRGLPGAGLSRASA